MKHQMDSHDVSNRPPVPEMPGQDASGVVGQDGAQGWNAPGDARVAPDAPNASQYVGALGQQPYEQPQGFGQYEPQQGYGQQAGPYQAPYGQQPGYGYQQPGAAGGYTTQQSSSKGKGTALKIIAVLMAGCLGSSMLMGVLMVAGLSLATASCVSSCSDDPIGDSREHARYISAVETNERDLETFDALSGCLESLYTSRCASYDDVISVGDIRAALEAGSWPELTGYNELDGPCNPQAWVRLAELSAIYLEEETGEQWKVVDFAYPFPDNGPIPVPPVRGENSYTCTRLVCTSGADKGLFAEVDYYRWQPEAYFENNLENARERYADIRETHDRLRQRDELAGRQVLMDGWELVVWSTGEDDPLRDPETFVALANELNKEMGGMRLALVRNDTPVMMHYDYLSYDYPNERDPSTISYEEACELLELSQGAFYFDCALADQLLTVYVSAGETATVDDLNGELVPENYVDYDGRWVVPEEGLEWSGELCAAAARDLGCDESQIVAVTQLEQKESWESTVKAWIVVPRGVLPETPNEFCEAANHLRDLAWELLPPLDDGRERHYLYLRIYVVDDTSITDVEGQELSFAQLREAVEADPLQLGSCSVDVLLGTMPSAVLWEGDDGPNLYDVDKSDVGGSIARSREWRYGSGD